MMNARVMVTSKLILHNKTKSSHFSKHFYVRKKNTAYGDRYHKADEVNTFYLFYLTLQCTYIMSEVVL